MTNTTDIPAIPATHHDLINGAVVVTLVTIMPDGQPQATPVWCSYDGTYVLVNTARGRQKDKNMTARAKVSVLALDPTNPYRYLEVRGFIADSTEEGAVEHIEHLSQVYTGKSYYGGLQAAEQRTKETRVIYKIQPTRIIPR
jgi:PPOX class probable F420-dependent enzyme